MLALVSGHAINPPQEPQAALWSVRTNAGEEDGGAEHCLLVSGNLSVIFVHRGEDVRTMSEDLRRLHWTKMVPNEAQVSGECGDLSSEVSFHWSETRDGETNRNLLNLVITRNNRIADDGLPKDLLGLRNLRTLNLSREVPYIFCRLQFTSCTSCFLSIRTPP